MLSIGLALSASVLWGVSDFVGGATSRRVPVVVVITGSQAVALAVIAPVVLGAGEPVPDFATVAIAAGAGAVGAGGLAARSPPTARRIGCFVSATPSAPRRDRSRRRAAAEPR